MGFLHGFIGSRPEVSIAHCHEAAAIADAGGFDELRALAESCRELGYRHLEGVAARLLGEVLSPEAPAAAANLLEVAARLLEDMGARNELAKALLAQAYLRRTAGDPAGARQLLERALALFEALGTLDEPSRVRSALAALEQRPAG